MQLDAITGEHRAIHGAKTGVLSTANLVQEAARFFRRRGLGKFVLDPVLHSSSGFPLLSRRGISSLKRELLPLAAVITPNLPEAEILTRLEIRDVSDMQRAAELLWRKGCAAVVVKGGHLKGKASDLLFDGRHFVLFEGPRITGRRRRGTGCVFSAAVAAGLAEGKPIEKAVLRAKKLVASAFRGAPLPGKTASALDPSSKSRGGKIAVKKL
jgi:hydroxymethylpyrimidine/phosphomethylpyrimidine kinase